MAWFIYEVVGFVGFGWFIRAKEGIKGASGREWN